MKAFSLLSLTVIMTASLHAGDLVNAINGVQDSVDSLSYQQYLDSEKRSAKDSLTQYFRYLDEFERLHPLRVPKDPDYCNLNDPSNDLMNQAIYEDYLGRVNRYNLRVAAYREAKR